MARKFCARLHRYVGLAMAANLIVVGLTGSLLAFNSELNRIITPNLFPPVHDGVPLDFATLAERAEVLVPQAKVVGVNTESGVALIGMKPLISPETGKSFVLNFNQLFLDPVTGAELGRRQVTDFPTQADNIMPFIYRLHEALALNETGKWILGITALVWTMDCFISFYLTLPAMRCKRAKRKKASTCLPENEEFPSKRGFLSRWKTAWLVKWQASIYRLNYDLHRAGGLWLWIVLLVFAWSSVYFNLKSVYDPATRMVFDYAPTIWDTPKLAKPLENPKLNWREAQRLAVRHLAEQAALHDFTVNRPFAMYLNSQLGYYVYWSNSSRDMRNRHGNTAIAIDANTGEFKGLNLPTGEHNGNTVTSWLIALHMADVFGMPYRIFVCILGLLIVMLSVTGVYIWWKKLKARQASRVRRNATEH